MKTRPHFTNRAVGVWTDCEVCGKRRKLSKDHLYRIKRGLYRNWCRSCQHKERQHPQEYRSLLREALKGEKNPNWRGGTTALKDRIRTNISYRMWRSDVFTRDGFTCQICGQWGRALHADHIKPFSEIIAENGVKTLEDALKCSELWNINNGRTLCENCHRKTETYGGKKKR